MDGLLVCLLFVNFFCFFTFLFWYWMAMWKQLYIFWYTSGILRRPAPLCAPHPCHRTLISGRGRWIRPHSFSLSHPLCHSLLFSLSLYVSLFSFFFPLYLPDLLRRLNRQIIFLVRSHLSYFVLSSPVHWGAVLAFSWMCLCLVAQPQTLKNMFFKVRV